MAYGGLMGKLGKDIFEGSGAGSGGVAKYMATGAATGAVSGAVLSDDSFVAGAFRGALFGAAVGGAINLAPKSVNSAFKNSGINPWQKGLEKDLGDDASRIFKPTYDKVNNKQNKELIKTFIPGAKAAYKTTKDDKAFSLKVVENLSKDMKNLKQADLDILESIGKNTEDNLTAFKKTKSYNATDGWFTNNKNTFDALGTKDKFSVGSSFITKAGFDSAYSHIVEPTGSFINKVKNGKFKDIDKFEASAAAFSVYGAYEAGHILNDASDGNIAGVVGGSAMLLGGKLAYGQGVNLIHANSFLKEKGMTWSGVGQGIGGGYFTKKLANGIGKWDTDDQLFVQQLFKGGTP